MSDQKSLRILVVDDVPTIQLLLATILKGCGHDALTAGGGKEAFDLLGHKEFDMVITDIMMDEGEGIELIRNSKKRFPNLKIVAMSAGDSGGFSYLNDAKNFGAHYILEKPVKKEALQLAITELFS